MKKTAFSVSVLLIVCAVFMGCSDQKQLAPMNNSLTPDNGSTLIYRKYFKIKEFNGSKTTGFASGGAKSASILIPAGRNTLKFNYSDRKGIPLIFTWGTKAKGMVTTFDFQPGKTYVLVSTQYGNFIGSIFIGQKMSVSIEEFSGGDLQKYIKDGYKKREKL